jgi:hypothetical protein
MSGNSRYDPMKELIVYKKVQTLKECKSPQIKFAISAVPPYTRKWERHPVCKSQDDHLRIRVSVRRFQRQDENSNDILLKWKKTLQIAENGKDVRGKEDVFHWDGQWFAMGVQIDQKSKIEYKMMNANPCPFVSPFILLCL